MIKEDDLSDTCLQKARDINGENPEFSEILNPLIQNVLATDDGRKLAETIRKIEWVLLLRKSLAHKQKELADLEKKITNKETELRSKIE